MREQKRVNTVSRLTGILLLVLGLTAPESHARDRQCPRLGGEQPFVYAIGSSTLGTSLGALLQRDLPRSGYRFRKWAKASSGLARPDFHDWLAKIPNIIEQWDPDVFVISLGTNDFQSLNTPDGWIRPDDTERWIAAYTERVDRALNLASGDDRKRMVIWVGPSTFDQPRARRMGQRIHQIVSERIRAFNGPAFHVDVYSQITNDRGRPQQRFTAPGTDRRFRVYGGDRIHLTRDAVRLLMSKPIIDLLNRCREDGSSPISQP